MEKFSRLGWSEAEASQFQYHELNNGPFIFPWPAQSFTSNFIAQGYYPSSSSALVEDRAVTASKNHSQAEKLRRQRINGHLSTLRRLVPRSEKLDKAALLGSVINHVKELKRKAMEVGKVYTVPTDVDEVCVECDSAGDDHINNDNKECILLKASVCCDDRPELFSELIQAVKGLKLRTVKADIATLGGRIINVMILCTEDSEDIVCLSSLKKSIKAVLSSVASVSMASVSDFSSKRKRMLLPSNYSHSSE